MSEIKTHYLFRKLLFYYFIIILRIYFLKKNENGILLLLTNEAYKCIRLDPNLSKLYQEHKINSRIIKSQPNI